MTPEIVIVRFIMKIGVNGNIYCLWMKKNHIMVIAVTQVTYKFSMEGADLKSYG